MAVGIEGSMGQGRGDAVQRGLERGKYWMHSYTLIVMDAGLKSGFEWSAVTLPPHGLARGRTGPCVVVGRSCFEADVGRAVPVRWAPEPARQDWLVLQDVSGYSQELWGPALAVGSVRRVDCPRTLASEARRQS